MSTTRHLGTLFLLTITLAFAGPHDSCGSKAGNGPPNHQGSQTGTAVLQGTWGGPHIQIEVTDKGATIEYDCAHGTISEPLKLDAEGRFQAKGTHVREHGGPIRDDEAPASHPAAYSGIVNGTKMSLSVTLTDSSETVGAFTLTKGSEAKIVKCR